MKYRFSVQQLKLVEKHLSERKELLDYVEILKDNNFNHIYFICVPKVDAVLKLRKAGANGNFNELSQIIISTIKEEIAQLLAVNINEYEGYHYDELHKLNTLSFVRPLLSDYLKSEFGNIVKVQITQHDDSITEKLEVLGGQKNNLIMKWLKTNFGFPKSGIKIENGRLFFSKTTYFYKHND